MGFSKLVSLTDFQKSSVLLFATFDIMLRRFVGQEVVILSFTSNFFSNVKFHSEEGSVIGNIKKMK